MLSRPRVMAVLVTMSSIVMGRVSSPDCGWACGAAKPPPCWPYWPWWKAARPAPPSWVAPWALDCDSELKTGLLLVRIGVPSRVSGKVDRRLSPPGHRRLTRSCTTRGTTGVFPLLSPILPEKSSTVGGTPPHLTSVRFIDGQCAVPATTARTAGGYRRGMGWAMTQDNMEFDGEYDVIVVGSGVAALFGAAAATSRGLTTCVVEKTDRFGGTSAYSGGAVWLPGNQILARDG